ncbi:hypothetical protein SAMN04487900_103199 [Prevotella communis]|uniref:Uncharacterized protein n=1 Tax=Prevotella communis TaxID=2913614 RepID=A0A1H0EJN2_9BACT|nr:hypothetical protein SAMN04487900_103199 [Prevotella communis]
MTVRTIHEGQNDGSFKGCPMLKTSIERFRAENRPKSMLEIWNRTKNVVPLYT